MQTDILLEFRQLYREYHNGDSIITAVNNINLQVKRGEFVAIMGPSGCGKTTLLGLAGGLDTPTRGEVIFNGTTLSGLNPTVRAILRRDQIGYVFQEYNLLPMLTALENTMFPLELAGISTREAKAQATTILERLGIAEVANRHPGELSGGQAQRVAIARALVGKRQLLLADEPTGALDSLTGAEIMLILREQANNGATILLVTHEARFAASADRSIFLHDGKLVSTSSPTSFSTL